MRQEVCFDVVAVGKSAHTDFFVSIAGNDRLFIPGENL